MLLSSSKNVGFIQFDIRKFKIINDLYGEKFGNEVLYFIQGQLKDMSAMARKAAKKNVLTNVVFSNNSLRNLYITVNSLKKICRLPLQRGNL